MIELNAEQRQAMTEGQSVRIIDPVTHDAYVDRSLYEAMDPDEAPLDDGCPACLRRGVAAHQLAD
jgi:hypothetical protein